MKRPKTKASKRKPAAQILRWQKELLRGMGAAQQFRFLFDHLPDVYFFAKDLEGRLFCVSKSIIEKLRLRDETDMLGTTDYDRYPPRIAGQFRRDDLEVQRSRKPLLNRLEVWYNEHGVLDWCITNKHPIFDPRGRVIGVMGTVRKWRNDRPLVVPYARIGKVLQKIRDDRGGTLKVARLAREAGMTPRHLSRRFVELFGVSVKEFLLRSRVQLAANALVESHAPLAQIALQSGFCDQSAFSQQFKKYMGATPLAYRKRGGVILR